MHAFKHYLSAPILVRVSAPAHIAYNCTRLTLVLQSFQLGSKRLQAAVQTSPDTDDVPCGVCGDRDFDEGNQIVFCDGCNVAVHQECYGVERIPEGPWFCDRCTSENPDSVRCELCPMEIGAFKRCVDPPGASPTRAGQRWAHLICALYIPGPRVVDTRRMGPIAGLEQVDTARRALVCSVCGVKAGVCIQCSEPRCYAAFHATCALLHGLWMETRDDRLLHYCRKHSDQRHEQELQKRIRDGTFLLDSARALGRHEATGKAARKLQLPGPVLQRVFEYWVQKRQRNGNQPLLPRLRLLAEEHLVAVIPISSQMKAHLNSNQLFMKLVYLRQELERLRTLLDLVRKREQYKRESTELSMRLFDLRLAQLTAEARARSARSASPCPVRGSASSVPARDRRPAPPDSRKRRRSLPASTPNHRSKHRRRSEEPEEPEEKEEEEEEEEEDEKESEEEEEESEGKEREEGQEEEEEEEEDSEEEEGSKEEADEEEQEEEEEEEAEESEEESKSKSADETRRQEQARAPAASVPTNGSVTEPLSMNEVRVCRRVLEACMADAGGEARELPKFERVAHRVARVDYRAAVKALTRAGRLLYAAGGSGGGSRYFLPAPLTLRNLLSWVRCVSPPPPPQLLTSVVSTYP
jgi:flagellar biosynthesis GTPase FlhF